MTRNGLLTLAGALGCLLPLSCRSSVPRSVPGDKQELFERAFGTAEAGKMEILDAALFEYPGSSGAGATDDWEFDLRATDAWVVSQVSKFRLSREEGFTGGHLQPTDLPAVISLVPDDLLGFEHYQGYGASIPYVHMLVAKQRGRDGLLRVVAWKH